ncbi:TlpA disulfide reductase family protein [Chitinophaga sp. 212800008-4]|uniref:TlpA disulfide reductase family protein n=1 Tax=unclassified Chitinophaga TaxID=2619133 RepID=UPI0030CDB34D
MKKITFLTLLLPVVIHAQPAKYVLNGKVTKLNTPAKIYLSTMMNEKLTIDSTDVRNGVFHFEGMVDGPIKALLVLNPRGSYANMEALPADADARIFILEKGDTKITATDNIGHAHIVSPVNLEVKNYQEALSSLDKTIRQINRSYNKASPARKADSAFIYHLGERFNVAQGAIKLLQQKFLAENPGSYASLQALTDLAGLEINPAEIAPLFQKLSPKVRSTPEGKAFSEEIERAKQLIPGATAPDFEVPDMSGKPVRLSDFKGKIVLLDFWASWYEPSRRQHAFIRKAYETFRNKNFTVISIAVDPPADRQYLLDAIREDSLSWTNLSDPTKDKNDAAKTYNVKRLPQNYLIDADGVVLNKDLFGDALEQELNGLLSKQNH